MSFRIGILSTKMGQHIEALQKALAKHGAASDYLPITRLVARVSGRPYASSAGYPLEAYDAIIVRIIPDGSLEQIIFRMDVLHRLEDLGIRIMNSPSTIERTVDKYYTSSILEAHGLPTPKTIVAEGLDEAMEAFRELQDVVVKPLFGAGGLGMVRITDPDIAYRTFRALELGRYIFYIQEYVPHQDHDIRAFVVGKRVIASMIRRSEGWRHNVARGAKPEPYRLDEEAEALSIKACEVLKADYAGVDLLRSAEGRYSIIEVNSIPGWSGLQKTTTVDIAGAIVDHLMELLGRV